MSARMRRNLLLLEALYKAPPRVRIAIVNNAGPDFINALCEIAVNVLRGNIPLTDKQYRMLKRNKTGIRLVANKKVRVSQKKKTINQSGGFLPALLGAAIPFIASLITRS